VLEWQPAVPSAAVAVAVAARLGPVRDQRAGPPGPAPRPSRLWLAAQATAFPWRAWARGAAVERAPFPSP